MRADDRTMHVPKRSPLIPPVFALLARPYLGRLMASCIVAVMIAGTSLIMPIGYGLLIDTLVAQRSASNVTMIAMGLIAVTCGKLGLGFVSDYLLRGTGERIVYDLRCKLYTHLLSLDIAFFNKRQLGEITAALTNDVTAVRGGLTDALMWVVVHGLRLVALVALMFALNLRLGVLVLLTWPLAVGIARMAGRTLEQLASTAQAHFAQSAAVAQETLAALRQVRLFNRDSYEIGRYRRHLDDALYTSQQSIGMRAGLAASLELVFALVAIVLFWFGGREVTAGRLTVGTLVTFLFYAEATAQSVTMVTNAYNTARQARGAAHRVLGILGQAPSIVTAPGAMQLRAAGRLELSGVCFSHDSRPLLRDISFVVEPGAVVAIVGPSGAGKSTLLDLIARLHDPTSGRITLDGHDLRDVDLVSLRDRVTLVSQDTRLFSVSARETVRYAAPEASDADVERAALLAAADDFIRAMPRGYETVIGDNGILLSGGQRQRLALAQAFVRTGGLLALDESTSAIDTRTEATILRTVLDRRSGRTTIFVSHRLAAAALADRIIVLNEGRVVGQGTHEELLQTTATYRELVESQLSEPVPELPSATLTDQSRRARRRETAGVQVARGTSRVVRPVSRLTHAGQPGMRPLNQDPRPMMDHIQLSAAIADIAGFMHGTADFERDDRLWPASFHVFATNPMSLAYGAAGNALFLHRAQGELPRRVLEWMLARKVEARHYPPGLFVGSAGIAYVYGELGEWDRACEVMESCYASPLLLSDATYFHGAAGWGMVSLYLHDRTGESRYLEQAAVAANAIASMATPEGEGCYWISAADGAINYGFGYGASGIALFLLHASQRLARPELLELGRRALDFDLANRTEDRFGWSWPARRDEHVALPYWGHGACGVGVTALRYHEVLRDAEYQNAARTIADSVHCKWTVLPGLIDGITGLGDYMIDMYRATGEEEYLSRAHEMANTALWYKVRRQSGIAFPGRWLNRLTTDYATGSAGIGLFFQRLTTLGPKPVIDMMLDVSTAASPPRGLGSPYIPSSRPIAAEALTV